MSKKQWIGAGLGLGATLLCNGPLLAANSPDRNIGMDLKITGQFEDDRDLGTRGGGDVSGVAIDARPWVYGRHGDWSGFFMLQAVSSTDIIETDPIAPNLKPETLTNRDKSRDPDKSYLALREFWIDYRGLTPYPGEHLRFGRQRVYASEGTWWDTRIEALNWMFDSTLLRAQLGAAERFSDYRTDYDDLSANDEKRANFFGGLDYQWHPGHWAGFKLHHVHDYGDLPSSYDKQVNDQQSKPYTGNLTWVGLHLDGDFFNYRSRMPVNYWGELTWLTGHIKKRYFADATTPADKYGEDVNAWAIDLGLRWNINEQWKLGAAYARGSGSGNGGEGGDNHDSSGQFVQTGMQSNRSSFTGVQTRIHRFGEAFRGQMTNTQVASLFTSWRPNDTYEGSLIYHRFWRVDDNAPIGSSGVSPFNYNNKPALQDGRSDLGQEVDLVIARYFRQGVIPGAWDSGLEDQSALVRLRSGLFFPGNAYASKTDTTMYRVFLDFVWRF